MGQLPVECAVLRAIATAAVAQSGRYAWDHMGPFLAGKEADAEGPDNRDLSQVLAGEDWAGVYKEYQLEICKEDLPAEVSRSLAR